MLLSELIKELDYEILKGNADVDITEVFYYSRKAVKGGLYVAISGAVVDGHSFIDQVVESGAAAVLVEKDIEVSGDVTVIKVADTRLGLACVSAAYFGHPASKLKTIGITGTKGKTTTTYMVKSILENAGIKTGLIGTIETIIGDKHIPASNTTPESYVVQQSFKEMVDEDTELISVYKGQDVSDKDAKSLLSKLDEAYPDCDVEMNDGGQPVYYYILSVE